MHLLEYNGRKFRNCMCFYFYNDAECGNKKYDYMYIEHFVIVPISTIVHHL